MISFINLVMKTTKRILPALQLFSQNWIIVLSYSYLQSIPETEEFFPNFTWSHCPLQAMPRKNALILMKVERGRESL